jgi:predicted metal-dependent phosphoesterase TrpH
MPGFIDLHIHTTMSDGALTPPEVLEKVRAVSLAAFALADHDTISGYRQLVNMLGPDDPELITGLELSVAVNGADMHMLAYLFDPDHAELNETLVRFQEGRNLRGGRMVQRLNERGLALPLDDVLKAANGSAIGRPHIADALVYKGLVASVEDAFRRHIGDHCPAYIPKSMIRPEEAISMIHRAGGLAVLAHPYINDMHKLIPSLVKQGLDGIEVYHYSHNKQQVQELKRLAVKYQLIRSGGSDFHGRQMHEGEIGAYQIPLEFLETMKDRTLEIRGRN